MGDWRSGPCTIWRKGFSGTVVQRPWGSTTPHVLEEQWSAACVWNRLSKAERRWRGGQGGAAGKTQALIGRHLWIFKNWIVDLQAVWVSGVHVCMYAFFFTFFSIINCYKILNIHSSLYYWVGSCYLFYISTNYIYKYNMYLYRYISTNINNMILCNISTNIDNIIYCIY